MREGPLSGQRLRIDGPLVIGREGVDVVIADREISRRHAALRLVEGAVVIEDLHSLNGTWVNGGRIATITLLAPGDQITIGKSVMELRPDSS
jgi:pSer/pThr/pTyr-binding forkhead associated (FHA) protein